MADAASNQSLTLIRLARASFLVYFLFTLSVSASFFSFTYLYCARPAEAPIFYHRPAWPMAAFFLDISWHALQELTGSILRQITRNLNTTSRVSIYARWLTAKCNTSMSIERNATCMYNYRIVRRLLSNQ